MKLHEEGFGTLSTEEGNDGKDGKYLLPLRVERWGEEVGK
jgi:hypothetical protein